MNDEVTLWINSLKTGDDEAAQLIWQRYFDKLVNLARRRLGTMPRRVADEEDVALSAFDSFCQAARDGRCPKLNDRSDLWKLLITITIRKANAQLRRQHRQKRGGGLVRGESAFVRQDGGEDLGIADAMGDAPTPEFAATVVEEFEELLGKLDDESLRTIALYKFEGYTNDEIAEKLDCVSRTVARKLERIRRVWESP